MEINGVGEDRFHAPRIGGEKIHRRGRDRIEQSRKERGEKGKSYPMEKGGRNSHNRLREISGRKGGGLIPGKEIVHSEGRLLNTKTSQKKKK